MSTKDERGWWRRHRLGWLTGVVVLTVGGWLAVRLPSELDNNIKAWLGVMVGVLGVLLGLVWFVFLSRFSWRVRLGGLVVLVLAGVGIRSWVRVDGTVDGTGLPRLRWAGERGEVSRESAPVPGVEVGGERVGAGEAGRSAGSGVEGGPVVVDPPVPAGAADTPQFLGPGRNGYYAGLKLARDWEAAPPREVWRQAIGGGWSSFAVVGGRAFTQEQRGEDEWVSCYELGSGRMLWAHTNRARFFQWQGGEGPRATPTVDGGRVYALGGTGILDCLEAATGRRVWSRDVLVENGIPNLTWGASASPLVAGDVVVVTGGMTNRSTVLAYHRGTGEPLWQAGGDKASYASPVLAELAGRRLVLSVNAGSLTGHDPATGVVELDVVWGRDNRPKATQPVVLDGDRVFLSAGYAEGCVMLRVKAGAGGRLEAEELWRNKRMKTQFNTAVHVGGSLYGLDDGLLACVDAVTGERLWKDGRYGAGQSVVVEDVVLVQSERGPVVMVAAEREGFRELGRLAGLDSKTWNYPALAGRYLLIRNDREAVCYELPVAVAGAVAGAGGVSGR